ncbi:MAG: YtxH domain-containing protein [Candidatus Roizmanbacteria bacterium]|nr:MAG: YtxH domain-containing protein [Candidatus Roizmanbacteria bacterium]
MNNNKNKFSVGVVVGMIMGILTGIFIAPKSGKENREAVINKLQEIKEMLRSEETQKKVKELFGIAGEEGLKIYNQIVDIIDEKLNIVKERVENIDKDKYVVIVKEAIEQVKKETNQADEKLNQLKDYFVERWNKLVESEEKTTRKIENKRKK